MSYQNVKDSRRRLKERLLYVMGSKCCICGYDKCNSALEFHHLDPNEKDFTLGANTNISFARANEEIKKCILVCANCHREIHEGLVNTYGLQCYSEKRANEVFKQLEDLKTKKLFYCKNCGKQIWTGSTYCPECAGLTRRRVDERPTREELKEMIRTLPFTTIADNYGITDNAIRKWCDAYNLPRKKTEIKEYTDAEWKNI